MMSLSDIIKAKYGSIDFMTDVILVSDGGDPCIAEWNLPAPRPTIAELEAWAADNQDLILEPTRQTLRTEAENTFYRLASEKTGEPINALIIQEWQAKEMLVTQWVAEAKPAPTADNDYALAYYEAQGDPDKDASQLMEAWLTNATAWRQLNTAYIAWRQGFRAQVKAADEAALEVLRVAIEAELRGLLQIS